MTRVKAELAAKGIVAGDLQGETRPLIMDTDNSVMNSRF